MKKYDILIIGAGAAGLMAARKLAKAGKQVIVLEARNRCGGRIHTLKDESFFKDSELGAEFVHGDLPVTLILLNEAGIKYHSSSAEMLYYKNGEFDNGGGFNKDWDILLEKLNQLKKDISIADFLRQQFPEDKYDELKSSVSKFVSGYDTADPEKASAFALRQEWNNEDDGAQHRVAGGYGTMISYLEEECKQAGGQVMLNSIVKEISWQKDKVKAVTTAGDVYEGGKILVALPLGVLQSDQDEMAAVNFVPAIAAYTKALNAMGFGSIIKILLEFDEPFWEDSSTGESIDENLKNMGFLISDEEIPTWWTQLPQRSTVLTGWLGGKPALVKKDLSNEEIMQQSLNSLGNIFKRSAAELKNKLVAYQVLNWTIDPFTRGSYAYDTIEAPSSRKLLLTPIEDTLFFAGEYLYDGAAMGTVEAALNSGLHAAEMILARG